ncbi:MAG: hypothetical protein JWO82_3017 [Akkermansiaceae bacterium]|nr:hypothetical protein [Akkermansiaceae bacterium]
MSGPDAEVLNAAFLRYVATWPVVERLQEFFFENGLEGEPARAIRAALDGLMRTAEKYLWDYPGGVPWGEAFEQEYRDYLKGEHPWIDEDSVRRVFGFAHWLCWHDGLNRPE